MDLPYYKEVLNTIESIYENIEIDDVKSASLFMESTMNYLDKYGNISAIERILEVMKDTIPMGRQHRRETALYYSYLGGVALQKMDWETAVSTFRQGIIFAEPVNQEYAELASNLYCNLGTAYLGKKNVKDGRKYQKKGISIREKYRLPFKQDALVQEMYRADMLADKGRAREAREHLSELIEMVEKMQENMEISLGQLYATRGMIEQKMFLIKESQDDLKKAREYLGKYLPPDNINVRQIRKLLGEKEVQRIAEKKV